MNATTAFYRIAYPLGFHPWEKAEKHRPFVESLTKLLAREERGRRAPYGQALDLGCGSAIWGVHLARRGWDVTGIDNVDAALRRARERVQSAGVDVRLVKGDVTGLRAAGIGTGFRLVLDTGTFHGLTREDRALMGREVSRVAGPDATVLLLVWAPMRRGPLPHGASREDVEAAFPGFMITDVVAADPEPPALYRRLRSDEHWYRLRRIVS